MHSIIMRLLFTCGILFSICDRSASANAVGVDLQSGTTGSLVSNQSFNGETRAADVSLLGAVDQLVLSMTVAGVSIRDSDTPVGARVYDSGSGTTVAAADVLVPAGEDQTITVPIQAALSAGDSYRMAFFVSSGVVGNFNNGDLFDPDPPSLGGFGYVESCHRVAQQVDAARHGHAARESRRFPIGTAAIHASGSRSRVRRRSCPRVILSSIPARAESLNGSRSLSMSNLTPRAPKGRQRMNSQSRNPFEVILQYRDQRWRCRRSDGSSRQRPC